MKYYLPTVPPNEGGPNIILIVDPVNRWFTIRHNLESAIRCRPPGYRARGSRRGIGYAYDWYGIAEYRNIEVLTNPAYWTEVPKTELRRAFRARGQPNPRYITSVDGWEATYHRIDNSVRHKIGVPKGKLP